MTTKEQCFEVAGRVLGRAIVRILSSTPEEVAREAYEPGGPSLAELEEMARKFQAKAAARAEREAA